MLCVCECLPAHCDESLDVSGINGAIGGQITEQSLIEWIWDASRFHDLRTNAGRNQEPIRQALDDLLTRRR